MKKLNNPTENFVSRRINQRRVRRWVALLSALVLFLTVNTLKLEADTLEKIATCGIEQHVHDESCYDASGALTCGLAEHAHTDACFQQRPQRHDLTRVDGFMPLNAKVTLATPMPRLASNSANGQDAEQVDIDYYSDIPTEVGSGIEPPVDEIQTELAGEEAAPAVEDAVPLEIVYEDQVEETVQQPEYVINGSTVLLSDILSVLGMKVSGIHSAGELEGDTLAETPVNFAVEATQNDYELRVLRDFDAADLAVMTDDEVIIITLKNGIAPVEDNDDENPSENDDINIEETHTGETDDEAAAEETVDEETEDSADEATEETVDELTEDTDDEETEEAADETTVDATEEETVETVEETETAAVVPDKLVALDFADYDCLADATVYFYAPDRGAVLVNAEELAEADGVHLTVNAPVFLSMEADLGLAELEAALEEAPEDIDVRIGENPVLFENGVLIISGDGELTVNGVTYSVTNVTLPSRSVESDNIIISTVDDQATLLGVTPAFEDNGEDEGDIYALFAAQMDENIVTATSEEIQVDAIEPAKGLLRSSAMMAAEDAAPEAEEAVADAEETVADAEETVADAEETAETENAEAAVETRTLRVRVYDVSLIREGESVEPDAPIHVETTFDAPLEGENFQLYHIVDGKPEEVDGFVKTDDQGRAIGMSFDTASLSPFAVVYYTVDFEYVDPETGDTYIWSFPGQGAYSLSDIMAVLGVESAIISADLELVEGELIEGALYLIESEGEYTLHSDVPFHDVYRLTVNTDERVYLLYITDANTYVDLSNLLYDVDIKNSNNENVIEEGNKIVVDFEKTYDFTFKFRETVDKQFDNNSDELTYTLPEGVDLNLLGPTEFEVKIGARKITGNTYEVVAGSDGKKLIKIKFNKNHPNYAFLKNSQDVEVDLHFAGKMTKEYSENNLNFSAEVNGYTVENKKVCNAKVNKTGRYDPGQKKMYYSVLVTATEGNPTNVSLTDSITGTALTFDSEYGLKVYQCSDENGNNVENTLTENTDYTVSATSGSGFSMNINSIPTGKTVKVEYMADVDFTKIASNNNATVTETGNGVKITAEGDETPDDNESKHEEKNINFSSITKTATSIGDVVNESGDPVDENYTGKTYRIIEWTVVANTEGIVTLKDSAITDTLLNNEEVEYYGNGITVKKKENGGTDIDWSSITGADVAWANVGVADKTTASGWTYTPTDNGKYAYQITYKTRVDLSTIPAGGSKDIVNGIKDKYDEDTGKINIKKQEETKPTIDKSATSVNQETITWKISVDIPKNWTGPLVVTDTLPNLGNYYDEIVSINVDGYTKIDAGNTIGAGQYTESIERGTYESWEGGYHLVDAGSRAFTLDFGTIAKSSENRTINITVVTRNNPEWIQLGMQNTTQDTAVTHYNTVKVTDGGDNEYGEDKDGGQPKPPTLTKTAGAGEDFQYYNDATNEYYSDAGWIVPFEFKLTNVTTANIDITETFNTDLFEIYTGDNRPGYNKYKESGNLLRLYYNNVPQNYGDYVDNHITVEPTSTGAILHLTDMPRTAGNAFWGFYTVKYYLVLKRGKMDDLKSFVAENGDVVGSGDNKTSKQYIFHNHAEWNGVGDSAPYTYTVKSLFKKDGTLDNEGNYNYTITLNPDKLKINNNDPYELTDVFSGVTVDVSTISITSDPSRTYQIYTDSEQAAADTTADKIVLLMTDGVISATIPDSTKVVISYKGVPTNAVTIDTQKNKAITEERNTAKALDFEYHVDYTHEHTVVAKTRKDNADGSKTYTLDLNPDKLTLKGGANYPLTDTFSGLNIDDATFKVTVCDPDSDGTKATAILGSKQLVGNVYTFSIPDATHVTITYDARPIYTIDQAGNISATISNTAEAENVVSGDGPHDVTDKVLTKGSQVETEEGIPFSIVFNPTYETLNDGEDIELIDAFRNLIVEYSTITIEPSTYPDWHEKHGHRIEYNYSGNEGTFKVPDKTKITLSYVAKPNFNESENVEWSNKVTAKDYTDETGDTSTETHSGEGFGSLPHSLYLLKYQTGHMEIPLNGVQFKLSMDVNGTKVPVTYATGEHKDEQVIFTTAHDNNKGDGYSLMLLPTTEEGINAQFIDPIVGGFKPDTIYYLDEVNTPEGYYENTTSYNFVWHSSKQIQIGEDGLGVRDPITKNYVMEDNPNHPYVKPSYMTGQQVYVFTEGETVKISNDKITRDVEVSKNWVNGDGTWDWPAGIDKVTVKLQQKVEGEDWKDISVENGNIPSQYWNAENNDFAEGYTWSSTLDLTKDSRKKSWTELDLEKDDKAIEYRVVEVSLTSGSTTVEFDENNTATINGKTYVALGGTVKNGSTTLLNEEKRDIEYEKRWNVYTSTFNWVVPEGVTVTDGTTTYNPSETVTINKSDLKIKVRLHRYAMSGGDEVDTYDFEDNDPVYNVELSGSTWTHSWSDLDSAFLLEQNGTTTEVDYIYRVEETEITVPTNVLHNSDGSAVDLSSAFKSETTTDANGKIIMTNKLVNDDNYYLTVEKDWQNYKGQKVNTGEPVQFKLFRSGSRTTVSGEENTSDINAKIYIKNAYSTAITDYNNSNVSYGGTNMIIPAGHNLVIKVYTTNPNIKLSDMPTKISINTRGQWDWNTGEEKTVTVEQDGSWFVYRIDTSDINSETIKITLSGLVCVQDPNYQVYPWYATTEFKAVTTTTPFNGEVLMPGEGDSYIVDDTGNYRFTINPGETIAFANLPYHVESGDTTAEYTYEIIETSTDTNWHVVTSSGTYNPAPQGSEVNGHNGTVKLVNQYDEPPKGALKLTKIVTVDDKAPTDDNKALTNGTYSFTIKASGSETVLHTVTITYEGGVITGATLDGSKVSLTDGYVVVAELEEGDYVIAETAVDGMITKVSGGKENLSSTESDNITVTVTDGDTAAAETTARATFTNNLPVTSVSVRKIWNDSNDQDGIRPKSVTVKLKNGQTVVTTVTLNADNDWFAEVKNLPKYAGGSEIEYTWEENVPEGYTLSSSIKDGENTNRTYITNTHVPSTIDIPVNKQWVFANGDESWPEGVTVTVGLYKKTEEMTERERVLSWKDGVGEVHLTMTLSASNPEGIFSNQPKNDKGKPIEYTICEESVEGIDENEFTTTITGDAQSGYTITNTKKPGDLELSKVVSGEGSDPNKEFSFTIKLTAPNGGTLQDSYTVDKGTTGVSPAPSRAPTELDWTTTTTTESGEQTTTTNTNKEGTIAVTLTHNQTVTVRGLPAGTAYEITETDYSDEGYAVAYTPSNRGTITGGTTAKESVTATNTFTPGGLTVEKVLEGNATEVDKDFSFTVLFEKTDVTGKHGSYKKGTAENIDEAEAVDIDFGTGNELGKATVNFTLKGGEKVKFTGLPTGTTFTVSETSADQDGYETTVKLNGTAQTNKTVTGSIGGAAAVTVSYTNAKNTTEIEATKAWKQDGKDIQWPEDVASVEFTLYRTVNGVETAVTKEDLTNTATEQQREAFVNPAMITKTTTDLKASWENLPVKYWLDANAGESSTTEDDVAAGWYEAKYTVKETKVTFTDGTQQTTAEDINTAFNDPTWDETSKTITNTVQTVTVSGTKTWNTVNSHTTPTLKLTRTVNDTTKTAKNNSDALEWTAETVAATDLFQPEWRNGTYTYSNLPKYTEDGKLYTYTVAEVAFTVKVDGQNFVYTVEGTTVTVNPTENAPRFEVTQLTEVSNDIVNTELTETNVTKVWSDDVDASKVTSITYKLTRSVSAVDEFVETVTIEKTETGYMVKKGEGEAVIDGGRDNWNYRWPDLPAYGTIASEAESGAPGKYSYTVEETEFVYDGVTYQVTPAEPAGYTVSVKGTLPEGKVAHPYWTASKSVDGKTITNTLNEKPFEVTKQWDVVGSPVWPEGVNSITLSMVRGTNSEPAAATILTMDDNFKLTLTVNKPNAEGTGTIAFAKASGTDITKPDEAGLNVLSGTVTEQKNGNDVTGYKIHVDGLEAGYIYRVEENPVEGYTSSYWTKSTNQKDGGEKDAYDGEIIRNTMVTFELPSTGGPGTTGLYIVGSILTLLALVLLITKKRCDGTGID